MPLESLKFSSNSMLAKHKILKALELHDMDYKEIIKKKRIRPTTFYCAVLNLIKGGEVVIKFKCGRRRVFGRPDYGQIILPI